MTETEKVKTRDEVTRSDVKSPLDVPLKSPYDYCLSYINNEYGEQKFEQLIADVVQQLTLVCKIERNSPHIATVTEKIKKFLVTAVQEFHVAGPEVKVNLSTALEKAALGLKNGLKAKIFQAPWFLLNQLTIREPKGGQQGELFQGQMQKFIENYANQSAGLSPIKKLRIALVALEAEFLGVIIQDLVDPMNRYNLVGVAARDAGVNVQRLFQTLTDLVPTLEAATGKQFGQDLNEMQKLVNSKAQPEQQDRIDLF